MLGVALALRAGIAIPRPFVLGAGETSVTLPRPVASAMMANAKARDLATSTEFDNAQFFRAELKMKTMVGGQEVVETIYEREYPVDPGGGGGSFGGGGSSGSW